MKFLYIVTYICATNAFSIYKSQQIPNTMRASIKNKRFFFHSSAPKARTSEINMKYKFSNVPCGDELDDQCLALCDDDSCQVMSKTTKDRIEMSLYIIVWFVMSTAYNIQNKIRLNMINLPWFQSTISLFTGSVMVLLMWLTKLRKSPKMNKQVLQGYFPIAACHALGHVAAVMSVSCGAVSFTQIVKAAEPVFTCVLSSIILGAYITRRTLFSLFVIVFGVSLASMSELSFSWLSFTTAMLSNLAFGSRNIFSRMALNKPKGENMNAGNLFGVLTIMSFLIALPFAIVFEGKYVATKLSISAIKVSMLTGLYFYIYNEAAMLALKHMNPVTHAVTNTLKRIVILISCIVFFNTPLTTNGVFGSIIALYGSYIYSISKK